MDRSLFSVSVFMVSISVLHWQTHLECSTRQGGQEKSGRVCHKFGHSLSIAAIKHVCKIFLMRKVYLTFLTDLVTIANYALSIQVARKRTLCYQAYKGLYIQLRVSKPDKPVWSHSRVILYLWCKNRMTRSPLAGDYYSVDVHLAN